MNADMRDINKVYLRRRGGLIINPGTATRSVSTQLISTVVANMTTLGYVPNNELLTVFQTQTKEEFIALADDIMAVLKDVSGDAAMSKVKPMYPNFPQQVMDASDATLYINALMHYLGDAIGARILPVTEEADRGDRWDFAPFKQVALATQDDVATLVTDLLTSKLSWGETEKNDFTTLLMAAYDTTAAVLDAQPQVGNRENRAWLWNFLRTINADGAASLIHDTDDVLRAAAAYSGASASLEPVTTVQGEKHGVIRFANIPRSLRAEFLDIINDDSNALITLSKRPGLYKALGEKLHPGDYKNRFPKAFEAFTALRAGNLVKANASVEAALEAGNIAWAAHLLADNPGALVRRLDHLLRGATDKATIDTVLGVLAENASKASTNVLWQAHARLTQPRVSQRAIYPKGSISRAVMVPETSDPAVAGVREDAADVLYAAILAAYADKDALEGSWFIDPVLDGIKVPNALRDASESAMVVGRGSHMPLPEFDGEKANVRLFIHWKDMDGTNGDHWSSRVDVDLSATIFDADLNPVQDVWYGNLRGGGVTHSGDITSAPNGAVEYIDVDREKVLAGQKQYGARYIGISIRSYSGQKFSDIPECFAGVEVLGDDMQAGALFDARSVLLKFAVTSQTTNTIPLLLDLVTGEVVWADMNSVKSPRSYGNVGHDRSSSKATISAVLAKSAPTVGAVLRANVKARGGELARSAAEADQVLGLDATGATIRMDDLLANWL